MKWEEFKVRPEVRDLDDDEKREAYAERFIRYDKKYATEDQAEKAVDDFNKYADSLEKAREIAAQKERDKIMAPYAPKIKELGRLENARDLRALGDIATYSFPILKLIAPIPKELRRTEEEPFDPMGKLSELAFGEDYGKEADIRRKIEQVRQELPEEILRKRDSDAGIVKALREGMYDSTMNKARLSMDKENIRDFKDDPENKKVKYKPAEFKESLAYSVANLVADLPIYALGGLVGKNVGTFGLPSGVKELYEKKLSGEFPTYTLENLLEGREFSPDEWNNLYNSSISIGKETAKGMAEGALFGMSMKGFGKLAEKANLVHKWSATGAKAEGVSLKQFVAENTVPAREEASRAVISAMEEMAKLNPKAANAVRVLKEEGIRGNLAGQILETAGLKKLATFADDMSRVSVEAVMPGRLGRAATMAAAIPVEGSALAVASSFVRGEELTKESLAHNIALVGLLKGSHAIMGYGKRAISPSREAVAESINKDVVQAAAKAAEISPADAAKLLKTDAGKAALVDVIEKKTEALNLKMGYGVMTKEAMVKDMFEGKREAIAELKNAAPIVSKLIDVEMAKAERAKMSEGRKGQQVPEASELTMFSEPKRRATPEQIESKIKSEIREYEKATRQKLSPEERKKVEDNLREKIDLDEGGKWAERDLKTMPGYESKETFKKEAKAGQGKTDKYKNYPQEQAPIEDYRVEIERTGPGEKPEKTFKNQKYSEKVNNVAKSVSGDLEGQASARQAIYNDPTLLDRFMDKTASGYEKLNDKQQASVRNMVLDKIDREFNPDRHERMANDSEARVEERSADIEDYDAKLQAFLEDQAPLLPTKSRTSVRDVIRQVQNDKAAMAKIAQAKEKAISDSAKEAEIREIAAEANAKQYAEDVRRLKEDRNMTPEEKAEFLDRLDKDEYRTIDEIRKETDKMIVEFEKSEMSNIDKAKYVGDYFIKSWIRKITEPKGPEKRALESSLVLEDRIRGYRRDSSQYSGKYNTEYSKALREIEGNIKKIQDAPAQDLFVSIMDGSNVESRKAAFEKKYGQEKLKKVEALAEKTRKILDDVAEKSKDSGMVVELPWVSRWEPAESKSGQIFIRDHKGNPVFDGEKIMTFKTERQAKKYIDQKRYVPFESVRDYFPHYVHPEILANKPLKAMVDGKQMTFKNPYYALVEYLWKTDQIEGAPKYSSLSAEMRGKELRSIIEKTQRTGNELFTVRDGNLEVAREFKLPEWAYARSYDVINRYINATSDRIARAERFGVRDEKIYDDVLNIAEESASRGLKTAAEDAKIASNLVEIITGKSERRRSLDSITEMILAQNVIRKMPMSVISQVPQYFAPMWRSGEFAPFIKAVREIHSKNKTEAMDWARESGAAISEERALIISDIHNSVSGLTKAAQKMLEVTGFTSRDVKNRVVAALTGKFYSIELADNMSKAIKGIEGRFGDKVNVGEILEKYNAYWEAKRGGKVESPFTPKEEAVAKKILFLSRRMKQLDIDPKEVFDRYKETGVFKLTDAEMKNAGRKFEVDTNFRAYAEDLPEFRKTNPGRILTQLKTFNFEQTKSIREYIFNEAREGNWRPMLMIIPAMMLPGALAMSIRELVTAQPISVMKALRSPDGKDKFNAIWSMMQMGGLLGLLEIPMGVTKYGDPGAGPTVSGVLKMMETFKRLGQAEDSDKRKEIVGRYLVGELPMGNTLNRVIHGPSERELKDYKMITDPRFRRKEEKRIEKRDNERNKERKKQRAESRRQKALEGYDRTYRR